MKVSLYILAQTGGSILGSYVGELVYGIKPEALMTRPIQGCTAAFWVEVIAAFVILFLTASMLSEPNIVRIPATICMNIHKYELMI